MDEVLGFNHRLAIFLPVLISMIYISGQKSVAVIQYCLLNSMKEGAKKKGKKKKKKGKKKEKKKKKNNNKRFDYFYFP